MAALDLLGLEPNKISRDVNGKYILIAGAPKIGKTSFAAQIPNNLILSFEPGTKFLSGVFSVPLSSWSEMRQYLSQLRKPEVKARFSTITIDTISLAYLKCEEYICKREEAKINEKNTGEMKVINHIREIPWGQGFNMPPKEFGDVIREIVNLGYGICMLAHSREKTVNIGKDPQGNDITTKLIVPDIDEKTYNLINTILDVTAYADKEIDEDGNETRYLYTSGRDDVLIGTRYRYLASKTLLDYPSFVKALNDALDKQAELDGAEVLDNGPANFISQKASFSDVMAEARQIWQQLIELDKETNGPELSSIVQKYLGNVKLSQAKASQQDLVEVIVAEMKSLLK